MTILPSSGHRDNKQGVLTPKGFNISAQGCRFGQPWDKGGANFNPERVAQNQPIAGVLCNPFRVALLGIALTQGDASLALGCVVKPLRGKEVTSIAPWAINWQY
jgi:hypothetical protein